MHFLTLCRSFGSFRFLFEDWAQIGLALLYAVNTEGVARAAMREGPCLTDCNGALAEHDLLLGLAISFRLDESLDRDGLRR